jgi:hypothetical protein
VEFLNERMPRVEVLAVEIRQYRAAGSKSGALVPRVVGQTSRAQAAKAERLLAEAALCATPASARMTRAEIKVIVERFTSIAAVIRDANAADKAAIYRGINLTLIYQPEACIVQAQAHLNADFHGVMVCVREGT